MKKIGVREAETYLTVLLRELPFAITRYGIVIAEVHPPSKKKPKKQAIAKTTSLKKSGKKITKNILEANKAGLKLCKHNFPPGLCKFGCK